MALAFGWWLAVGWSPCASAQAPPPPVTLPAEEIVVYGDRFARWDGTRWYVEGELLTPIGLFLARDENAGFTSHALRVEAVLACDPLAELGSKRLEVGCTVEDLSLQAHSRQRVKNEADRDRFNSVVDQLDAKLSGARLQLQVHADGRVLNVGLDGLPARNRRELQATETLRQILLRVVAGFHLRLPETGLRAGQWVEPNSTLMQMPTVQASAGATNVVHTVSPYEGLLLVQTLGEGVVTVPVPQAPTGQEGLGSDFGDESYSRGAGSGATPTAMSRPSSRSGAGGAVVDVEVTYDMALKGVAVFEPSTGILKERVWSVEGQATAGSLGSEVATPYRQSGRLRLLGDADRPSLGPTAVVNLPGQNNPLLPPWPAPKE